jgi:hypothetical protein
MKNNQFYEQSESVADLLAALSNFNSEVGKIIKSDVNPHLKIKYAGMASILDAVFEPMRKNGLMLMQKLSGDNTLTTTIYHVHTGQYISNAVNMIISKPDPQGFGSAVTYYKRYSIVSLLCLNVDDDDDVNAATVTAKDAVRDINAAKDRATFERAMQKHHAFLKDESVLAACKEMALKFPKTQRYE